MTGLQRSLIGIGFSIALLGGAAGYAEYQDNQQTAKRCDAFIRGFELLGEELQAPQERIDAFVQRLHDETSC